MKKPSMIVILLITFLLPLSTPSTHAAAAQVTLKVKKIFAGDQLKFITNSGSVWEYDSIQAHQVSGLSNIVALTDGSVMDGTFALGSDGSVWHYDTYFKSKKLIAFKGITAITQRYGVVFALDGKGNLYAGSDTGTNGSDAELIQTKVKYISANSSADVLMAVYTDGTVATRDLHGKWSQIKQLKNIVSVYDGFLSSYALDNKGTVWAWGSNSDGDLGDGTTIDRSSPVKVQGLPTITAISQSKALAKDGTVWAWGNNSWGQLGDGSPATPTVFVKTSNSVDFGNPFYTPYEVASSTPHSVPVKVKGLTNVVQLADRYALDKQGVVWGWGDNRGREILNSELTAITEPRQLNLVVNTSYPGTWVYKDNSKYSGGRLQIALADGRIFVHGYEGTFLYNPLNGKIVSRPDLKLKSSDTNIYPLTNGKILFEYGGAKYQILNPDTWASNTVVSPPFYDVESVIPLSQERILFLGVKDSSGDDYNHAVLYDIKQKKWIALPDMSDHRISPVAAELPNGKVLVAGGGNLASSALEILDLEQREWTSYVTYSPEQNDINIATRKIIPIDSDHVVIVRGGSLYTVDLTNYVVKEYSYPRSKSYMVSYLNDNQVLLLGQSEAYTFNAVTGEFHAFKHPGRALSIYDLFFNLPNGNVMYFGYSGEFTLVSK